MHIYRWSKSVEHPERCARAYCVCICFFLQMKPWRLPFMGPSALLAKWFVWRGAAGPQGSGIVWLYDFLTPRPRWCWEKMPEIFRFIFIQEIFLHVAILPRCFALTKTPSVRCADSAPVGRGTTGGGGAVCHCERASPIWRNAKAGRARRGNPVNKKAVGCADTLIKLDPFDCAKLRMRDIAVLLRSGWQKRGCVFVQSS